MKKFTFFFMGLIAFSSSAFGQLDVGIMAGGGLSKIIADRNTPNLQTKNSFAPSGQSGFFYCLNVGKKSLIGLNFLFNQIQSKEKTEFPQTDVNANPTGGFNVFRYDYRISYLSIPIYYGFKVKDFTLNLGVQTSFAIMNSVRTSGEVLINGSILHTKTYGNLNIDGYDIGPSAGLLFKVSKRIALEGSYYYGLKNILKKTAPPGWDWKVQNISLGIRYKLFSVEVKGKLVEVRI